MGPEACIRTFGSMLKDKAEASKATLLMLFMNAVIEEHDSQPEFLQRSAVEASKSRLDQLMPVNPVTMMKKYKSLNKFMRSPELVPRSSCYNMFLDFDTLFQSILKECIRYTLANGLKIKNDHSIVNKWPYRVQNNITKKEFRMHRTSSVKGYER